MTDEPDKSIEPLDEEQWAAFRRKQAKPTVRLVRCPVCGERPDPWTGTLFDLDDDEFWRDRS